MTDYFAVYTKQDRFLCNARATSKAHAVRIAKQNGLQGSYAIRIGTRGYAAGFPAYMVTSR